MSLWCAMWRSKNKLNGERSYLIYKNYKPVIFTTKKECSDFIKDNYGYIATRKDLRREPHGWRMPIAVKVTVSIQD